MQQQPRHVLTEADWNAIASDPEYRDLVARKVRFIVPATLFFIVYFFALPVSIALAPQAMARHVVGPLSLAYVFALSQFVMTWVVVALYLMRARDFDAREHRLVEQVRERLGT